MTQDSKITVSALLSAVVLFSLLLFLEWKGLDWVKWFGFTLWTVAVFGYLAVKYGEDLERRRCLLVFLAMLALHVTACVLYLRPVNRFPTLFSFFFAPFEAGIGAFILVVVGGARTHRTRRIERAADHKWPPDPT